MKKCFKCNESKPIDEFYKHKMMADGHLNKCKSCTKRDVGMRILSLKTNEDWVMMERARGREKSARRRASGYRTSLHYPRSKRDPIKVSARAKARWAVVSGRLSRISMCSRCGSGLNVQMHHEDYSRPLDVTWLCSACHGLLHRKVGL